MDWIQQLAEDKIKEAMKNGDFDQFPGKGKRLQLEDWSMIPEELRVGFKLLKNAGVLPEEMQLSKEMLTLQDLIRACQSAEEQDRLKRKLTEKQLRLQMLMEQRGLSKTEAYTLYEAKLREVGQDSKDTQAKS
ncbi:DnaJ family domain-containing protein [Paenibacillus sp. y28]|uniref:DnaJ family domain-containing protein n=1 Tax=Paenibacillus sp. y28 TaxID=3129110 RepID=UPI00301A950F